LLPLLRDLLDAAEGVLSLIATAEGVTVGHAVFTDCGITGCAVSARLLGPVAVLPERQGRGVGRTLIEQGLRRTAAAGGGMIFVLGDPAFYCRFGFVPETGIAPPYALPEAWHVAWQSLCVGAAAPPGGGVLTVPPPWRDPGLWLP
jgi:putative acetyltransferase